MKHLIQLLIVCCFFGYEAIQAQTANPATGGEASGAGGTVSYTVGQVIYTANQSSSGIVIQGCQQPYEIYVLTGLKEDRMNAELTVYPNPSSDFVNVKVDRIEFGKLSIQLYNNNGNLILKKKITEKETVLELGGLPPSSYILQVLDGTIEIKSFIIIKN